MSKYLIACIASGLVGAVAALGALEFLSPQIITTAAEQAPGTGGSAAATGPRAELRYSPPPVSDTPAPQLGALSTEEQINVAVYEAVNRSVVYINTRSAPAGYWPFVEAPSEGEGSGSVLDKQGHILTNYHVIEGAREIQVTLFDGTTHDAELRGQDPDNDIAVLKISAPADSLYPVTLGDSSALKVGQRVFAIGNPFGLERTLTTGIVSSLNRALPSRNGRIIKAIIQTDAAINPGNSGGPLLDRHGLLIGMNTAIASRTGQNTGVGFAIPVSIISRIVPELIEKGHIVRPEAGIAQLYETEQGLLIASLQPGGPAEQAGLQGPKLIRENRQRGPFVYQYQYLDRSAADLIVAIDGKQVRTVDDFLTAIESRQPGDKVTVTILREEAREDIELRLRESES